MAKENKEQILENLIFKNLGKKQLANMAFFEKIYLLKSVNSQYRHQTNMPLDKTFMTALSKKLRKSRI